MPFCPLFFLFGAFFLHAIIRHSIQILLFPKDLVSFAISFFRFEPGGRPHSRLTPPTSSFKKDFLEDKRLLPQKMDPSSPPTFPRDPRPRCSPLPSGRGIFQPADLNCFFPLAVFSEWPSRIFPCVPAQRCFFEARNVAPLTLFRRLPLSEQFPKRRFVSHSRGSERGFRLQVFIRFFFFFFPHPFSVRTRLSPPSVCFEKISSVLPFRPNGIFVAPQPIAFLRLTPQARLPLPVPFQTLLGLFISKRFSQVLRTVAVCGFSPVSVNPPPCSRIEGHMRTFFPATMKALFPLMVALRCFSPGR